MNRNLTLRLAMIALTMLFAICDAIGQVEWGVKAGVNIDFIKTNGLRTQTSANPPATMGYHLGVFGIGSIRDHWSLIGEIQYIRKGTRAIYPQLPIGQRINFEYFDIALLPAFHLTENLLVEAGPSFDIQTRLFYSESEFAPQNLVHFGLNMGARFRIHQGLNFNARYYHALTPFETYRVTEAGSPNQVVGTSQYFFRTLQLGLSYQFSKDR